MASTLSYPACYTAADAADYLYRLPRSADGVGLFRAAELLDELGNPQNAVPTVHVAGTAGKGSVVAFLSAILTAHGFRVGAHLSPHVHSLLERFQINTAPMDSTPFVDAVGRLQAAIAAGMPSPDRTPTFFEATNAVAFSAFASAALDYAVVETGIGGLLDATNTITRTDKLAVITRISLDHTELLGGTVAEIAKHKAGILPTGGHGVVQRHHQASVRAAIADVARARHCELDIVDPQEVSSTVTTAGTKLHHIGADLALGLQGRHQGVNATLAMHAAGYLATRDKWLLDPLAVRAGLATARLPGRCERHILDGRNVLLDGAHNTLKLIALADFVRALHPGPQATWVIALKTGKDLAAALAAIAPTAAQVIATQFDGAGDSSSIPAAVVADRARALGLPAVAVDDPVAALETALSYDYDPIVVAGSFHLVAAVSSALRLAERAPFAEALTMPMTATHPVTTLEPTPETAS